MSTYRPVQTTRDAGKGYVPPAQPLGFAADWAAIPISSGELMRFVGWYPVGFHRQQDAAGDRYQLAIPARAGATRALINPMTGRWVGRRLPLALRLYPFRLVTIRNDEGEEGEPTLAIDTDAESSFSTQAEQPLLDQRGQITELGQRRINALKRYQQRQARDAQVIRYLQTRELIVPWELDFGTKEMPVTMADWYQVDIGRLDALTGEDAARLHALGGWSLIYGHRYSQLRTGAPADFAERLARRQTAQSGDDLDHLFNDDVDLKFDFEL